MTLVIKPAHTIGQDILDWIISIVSTIGLDDNQQLISQLIYIAIVIGLAFAIGYLAKWLSIHLINRISAYRKLHSRNISHQWREIFIKASNILPAIIMMLLSPMAFDNDAAIQRAIHRAIWIYMLILIARLINSIANTLWLVYDRRNNVKNHPLKGLLQLTYTIVWLVVLILIISIIIGKSPVVLLTGLGAFAAILMLIFKSSILGVVSGIQLSQNDMVRVGDWIEVPGTLANGTVEDVTLTVVKIRNWDNTVAMLPPYSLVNNSFQNWRGMSESGARRIARHYLIDMDSIQFSTPEMLDRLSQIPLLTDYIARKSNEPPTNEVTDDTIKGDTSTNLGMLRTYMNIYLRNHPNISQTSTLMVRTLAPTPRGIPFQLYCFTTTTEWVKYEAIQSAIFEHLAAIIPQFGLYIYESTSGRDTVNSGLLEGGYNPHAINGLPIKTLRFK
ncbi:MAG: mechanosensitive ion channel [Bacteroidales bacterium]